MELMDRVSFPLVQARPELSTTKTTLYELIDGVSEEVQPGENQLVAEVVLRLFSTGQAELLDVDINNKSGWVL